MEINSSLDLVSYDPATGILTVEGIPVTYHCNIFNHFFSHGIRMILGEESGKEIVYRASEIAHYRLFRRLKERYGLNDRGTYEVGMRYFKSRGLGVLEVKGTDDISLIASTHAHTHMKVMKGISSVPVCDVERGFIAGLLEAALDVRPGRLYVEETECIAKGDPVCKLRVEVRKESVAYPEPDYSRVELYEVKEGLGERAENMSRIAPLIPPPDSSGIIAVPSRFKDVGKVWVSQLPTEYYSYANMRVMDLADRDSARYVMTLAGYACVFFTYVSLASTPIGELLIGDTQDEDEYIKRLFSMGNYLGFGVFDINVRGDGAEARIYNFYENNYLLALSREPVSYFLNGATLATYVAGRVYKTYRERSEFSILKVMKSFDDLYGRAEFVSSFDTSRNAQSVDLTFKM